MTSGKQAGPISPLFDRHILGAADGQDSIHLRLDDTMQLSHLHRRPPTTHRLKHRPYPMQLFNDPIQQVRYA